MVELAEKYLSASNTFNVAQEWVSWAKGQSLQLALGLGLREREILEGCVTKRLLKGGVGWKKRCRLDDLIEGWCAVFGFRPAPCMLLGLCL